MSEEVLAKLGKTRAGVKCDHSDTMCILDQVWCEKCGPEMGPLSVFFFSAADTPGDAIRGISFMSLIGDYLSGLAIANGMTHLQLSDATAVVKARIQRAFPKLRVIGRVVDKDRGYFYHMRESVRRVLEYAYRSLRVGDDYTADNDIVHDSFTGYDDLRTRAKKMIVANNRLAYIDCVQKETNHVDNYSWVDGRLDYEFAGISGSVDGATFDELVRNSDFIVDGCLFHYRIVAADDASFRAVLIRVGAFDSTVDATRETVVCDHACNGFSQLEIVIGPERFNALSVMFPVLDAATFVVSFRAFVGSCDVIVPTEWLKKLPGVSVHRHTDLGIEVAGDEHATACYTALVDEHTGCRPLAMTRDVLHRYVLKRTALTSSVDVVPTVRGYHLISDSCGYSSADVLALLSAYDYVDL